MQLTPEQVKGRIKNTAKANRTDARILLRIYMMERFLERLSVSPYKDNFIMKGGMLITSMVGVSFRSTMDIDTTVKNVNLSEKDIWKIIDEIRQIDIGDGIHFEIKNISTIMDNMEYPGIRFHMNAIMEKLITPLKIDISTGDIITPCAIEYTYPLLLDKRTICLWCYNLETILAEKLQTILSRSILNTRMRDFYDIWILLHIYENTIDRTVLTKAFEATCQKRETQNLKNNGFAIIKRLNEDTHLQQLWKSYQRKYTYACSISFENIMDSTRLLLEKMQ